MRSIGVDEHGWPIVISGAISDWQFKMTYRTIYRVLICHEMYFLKINK